MLPEKKEIDKKNLVLGILGIAIFGSLVVSDTDS